MQDHEPAVFVTYKRANLAVDRILAKMPVHVTAGARKLRARGEIKGYTVVMHDGMCKRTITEQHVREWDL